MNRDIRRDLIGLINADDYLFPHALANLTLACHECTDIYIPSDYDALFKKPGFISDCAAGSRMCCAACF